MRNGKRLEGGDQTYGNIDRICSLNGSHNKWGCAIGLALQDGRLGGNVTIEENTSEWISRLAAIKD